MSPSTCVSTPAGPRSLALLLLVVVAAAPISSATSYVKVTTSFRAWAWKPGNLSFTEAAVDITVEEDEGRVDVLSVQARAADAAFSSLCGGGGRSGGSGGGTGTGACSDPLARRSYLAEALVGSRTEFIPPARPCFLRSKECSRAEVEKELEPTCGPRGAAARGRLAELFRVGGLRLLVFWHVGVLNNWREVVESQARLLASCLGADAVSQLAVVASFPAEAEASPAANVSRDRILAEIHSLVDRALPTRRGVLSVRAAATRSMAWETDALQLLKRSCAEAEAEAEAERRGAAGGPAIALYFHTKGVSRFRPDWFLRFHEPRSYSFSLYWRRYMEYFLLENPELCIRQLSGAGPGAVVADTCGVDRQLTVQGIPFYSGNFFYATCAYAARLPDPGDPLVRMHGYTAPEYWVGLGHGTGSLSRHVSLFEIGRDLYEERAWRDLYAPAAEQWMHRLSISAAGA